MEVFRVSGIRACIARRSSAGATTLNINKLNLLDYKAGTPERRRRRRHRQRRRYGAEMRAGSCTGRKKGPERLAGSASLARAFRALYTFPTLCTCREVGGSDRFKPRRGFSCVPAHFRIRRACARRAGSWNGEYCQVCSFLASR